MTYTQVEMDEHFMRLVELRKQLDACTKQTYRVYEKIPSRGYERMSKLFVIFADDTRATFLADNDPRAVERQFEDALRQARRIYGQTVGVEA